MPTDIEPQGGIDSSYRSTPGGPKGSSLDPSVLANVQKITQALLWSKSDYNWGTSQLGNPQNQGAQGSQDNAQKRAKDVKGQNNPAFLQPNNATLAAASAASVLNALKQVDSGNKSGAIQKALDQMIQLNQLATSGSPGGIGGIVSGALGGALSSVAGSFGLGAVSSITSALSSGITNTSVVGAFNQALTGFLTGSGAGVFGTVSGAGNNAALASVIASTATGSAFNVNAILPNGAKILQTIIVNQSVNAQSTMTGTEPQDIASGLATQATSIMSKAIKTSNTAALIGLIESMFAQAQQQAHKATTGSNSQNILSDMASIIPEVAPIIQSVISGLANTLNNQQNITTLQQDGALVLSLAKKVWDAAHMFDGSSAQQSADVAGSHALAMSSFPIGSIQTLTTPLITIVSKVIQAGTAAHAPSVSLAAVRPTETQQFVFNAAPISTTIPDLTDLGDVDVRSLSDGATLVYDTATGKFVVEQPKIDVDGGTF